MSRRQSKPHDRAYRCQPCHKGDCENCTDTLRGALGLDPECPCTRRGHRGEPHGAPEHVCTDLCGMVNTDEMDRIQACSKCGGLHDWEEDCDD